MREEVVAIVEICGGICCLIDVGLFDAVTCLSVVSDLLTRRGRNSSGSVSVSVPRIGLEFGGGFVEGYLL